MTSTLTLLCSSSDALLQYFLFPPSCLFLAHSRRRLPEKTWENITRVFTRAEKAGQTNHLSLYCTTFVWQTFYKISFHAVFYLLFSFSILYSFSRCASMSQWSWKELCQPWPGDAQEKDSLSEYFQCSTRQGAPGECWSTDRVLARLMLIADLLSVEGALWSVGDDWGSAIQLHFYSFADEEELYASLS